MRILTLCAAVLAVATASTAFGGTLGRLIGVESNRSLYEIDMTTGVKTLIGTVSSNAGTTAGLAYDPATDTVYLTSSSLDALFTLDLATGNATLVGPYNQDVVMHGLEWHSGNGKLYGGSRATLFQIDHMTGNATAVGPSGLSGTSFLNLGYNSDTGILYGTYSGDDSFYQIDPSTGAATFIGSLNGSTNPNGLAYNPDDGRLYMVDNSTDNLYWIDMTTGAANLIGSTGSGNLLGLVYIPIPEPTSLGLLATAGLLVLRRRR